MPEGLELLPVAFQHTGLAGEIPHAGGRQRSENLATAIVSSRFGQRGSGTLIGESAIIRAAAK
jgi:hypothetical protein